MLKYLWLPQDLLALPESERLLLGPMKGMTWKQASGLAKNLFTKPLLVVTIYRASDKPSTVQVASGDTTTDITFDPGDQCYPITEGEWNLFISQEVEFCRLPLQVYVVDGTKYTAPI